MPATAKPSVAIAVVAAVAKANMSVEESELGSDRSSSCGGSSGDGKDVGVGGAGGGAAVLRPHGAMAATELLLPHVSVASAELLLKLLQGCPLNVEWLLGQNHAPGLVRAVQWAADRWACGWLTGGAAGM